VSTLNSQTYTANTQGQVVLSGGVIGSPGILERSGVGNPAIINPLGIATKVNLPSVGENFQDHVGVQFRFQLNPGLISQDELTQNQSFFNLVLQQWQDSASGFLTEAGHTFAFLPKQYFMNATEQLEALALFSAPFNGTGISPTLLAASERLWITDTPFLEIIMVNSFAGATIPAGANFISVFVYTTQPLSRGHVHISSVDPAVHPTLNPQYLQHPFDRFLLRSASKWFRGISKDPAFSAFVSDEYSPGSSVQTDAEWDTWIAEHAGSLFHTTSSCSMLPKRHGGVVDSKLKVYGTTNVRVVDASIAPLLVSAHTQAAAYAIAEKAADILSQV
jgi:choline dehydrogenase-like flavoprotein